MVHTSHTADDFVSPGIAGSPTPAGRPRRKPLLVLLVAGTLVVAGLVGLRWNAGTAPDRVTSAEATPGAPPGWSSGMADFYANSSAAGVLPCHPTCAIGPSTYDRPSPAAGQWDAYYESLQADELWATESARWDAAVAYYEELARRERAEAESVRSEQVVAYYEALARRETAAVGSVQSVAVAATDGTEAALGS